MTFALPRPRFLFLLTAVSVAGCAATPTPKLSSAPSAPRASEPHLEMAPIPNPTQQREEPRHVHSTPSEPVSEKAEATPAPPPPSPSPSNPLRAAQLRAAGLEQLNRGDINKAITFLKEASRLNPGNALIKHDLERALRVAKALHAKP